MLKQVLGSLAGKATAAAVGGFVAVSGLAVAGALPGDMQLAASKVAKSVGAEIPGAESTVIDTASNVATPTAGHGKGKKTDPGGPLPAPATTAAEAAHIHAFDVACGNHGAYVSHVARFGEEPACATAVRNGQTPEAVVRGHKGADDRTDEDADADDEQTPEEKAAKAQAKAERDAAREKAEARREKAQADRDAARAEAETGRDRADAQRDKAKAQRDAAKEKGQGRPSKD